ncbi:MAG: TonB family protein [Myxococcales bacterium]|nr:TonB family protein [Myxococcales bacterium]
MSSSDVDDPASGPAGLARARRTSASVWVLASVFGHLLLAGGAAVLVARHLNAPPPPVEGAPAYPPPPPDGPIVVELPTSSGETIALAVTTSGLPVDKPVGLAGGAAAHADDQTGGKGGAPGAKAVNLASANGDEAVSAALRDANEDQQNHLATDKHRVSPLDVRHALVPMELTFVASGKGFRYERHPVGNAALGAESSKPATLGGAPGGAAGEGALAQLGSKAGGPVKPIPGVRYGSIIVGTPQLVGAPVVKARPHVQKGKPTVAAGDKGAVTKDDQDADQAVAAALKSVVDTSPVGAVEPGPGKGGTTGPGAPGSNGSDVGASSVALGSGAGGESPKRTRWFLDMNKRIGPLVDKTFPKEAELELRNGVVIVELVIDKGGKVIDVTVVKPSNFPQFDKNVVTALRKAPGFDPIPDLVGEGPVRVRLPVQGGWQLD